ncbi:hypothetical protein M899_3463 [Bacteriovorax sp. BSW11_IV]|nr:hypothetical protein M899_3463 [Bacteriovorax sp. BSW11_IV]
MSVIERQVFSYCYSKEKADSRLVRGKKCTSKKIKLSMC